MNFIKYVTAFGLTLALVACGGGGGNPGTSLPGTSAGTTNGTSTTGNEQVTSVGSVTLDLVSGAGVSTNSISAIEIAQVKVIVKDAAGTLVSGAVVAFSESGPGLLKFAPAAQTALTNSAGLAVIEVRAVDQAKTGATTVSVTASVSGQAITAVKTLEVTNAPATGGVVIDPKTLASSINFLSTDPADKSIVLAGAGGNGRTETAVLKFRVVDKNNTPVKGVLVDFVVNPSADVTLNIAQSTTDADGVAVTSVSSKLVATSVVVKATVFGKAITSQSDQLKVTTGLAYQGGFEILPLVYNLDGALSGDSTDVTARLVDTNGNKVADGVPVVFVTDAGGIATSDAGGCNTLNGACTVKFEVQEPRLATGIATVTGTAKVGTATELKNKIKINMSAAPIYVFEPASGVPVPDASLALPAAVALTTCSKQAKTYMVANYVGYSAPSGTTLSVKGDAATGLGASIDGGSVVPDVASFGPTFFTVLLDSGTANNPACNINGIDTANASVQVTSLAPKSKRETKQSIAVTYPAGNLQLIQNGTSSTPAAVSMGACDFETTRIAAIGSDGLTLPAGASFTVTPSEASARAEISTVAPNVVDPGAPTNSNDTLLAPSSNGSRQSIWLRVRAPTGGTAPCKTLGTIVDKTFNVFVNVTIGGRINSQTVAVKYPGN